MIYADESVLFRNVHLISMESENVRYHTNVFVKDGKIASVGDEVRAEAGARIIDGTGLYLLPGLADMHVHLNYRRDLLLYLANGVTTVRNMRESKILGLFPYVARLKKKIRQGKWLGPSICTTGLIFDGAPPIPNPPFRKGTEKVLTAKKAKKKLLSEQKKGYGSIKVYNHLSKEVYQEIIRFGQEHNIPVVGHVPDAAGIETAIDLRQKSIEHLTGLDRFFGSGFSTHEEEIRQLIKKIRKNKVWNCPTLVVFTRYIPSDELEQLENREEMKYMPWIVRSFWKRDRKRLNKLFEKNKWDYLCATMNDRKKVVKMLLEEGADLILGTDSMDAFVVPGFAAHEELRLLVEAGLSPYEALKTATVNAAAYLNDDSFGTVTAGKRADLLLTGGNPLENIENISRIAGVMARGEWISKPEIQKMLKKLEQ